ncbi:hypothetical protein HPB50_023268 [Hyalomma asiaticum]|uniref:Uncharacterized protein n=1 Tax=Hyalomma asiaticum TaxID=266040 RepID=A0ACB7S7E2_HYAAI|nr:hypothetical protein HPB50_023268 [Hyalomma asiaticum]
METLKKKRKVIRSQVTRFTNDADKLLSSASAIDLDESCGRTVHPERRQRAMRFLPYGL